MRRRNGGREGTRRSASNLLRCRAGVVALEFALLGPVSLFTVILGIGFVHLYIVDACLRDALLETARYGATGQDSVSGLRPTNIQTMIASLSHVGPPALQLTMTSYSQYDSQGNAGQGWTNLAAGNSYVNSSLGPPGAASDVVIYTATYNDPLLGSMMSLIPKLGSSTASGSAVLGTLTERTVVQNEPYFSTQ